VKQHQAFHLCLNHTMSNSEQKQVEYRRLGKSGLRVSVPILGTMGMGSDKWMPWVISEDKVSRALSCCLDLVFNSQ
jgi:hypothetical protein